MRAVICGKYGSPEVLHLQEVAKPQPKDNEVLIKIVATTAHIGDIKIRAFKPGMGRIKDLFIKPLMRLLIGFTGPRKKILGMDLSGEIEAVGKNVTRFQVGDQVFASSEIQFGAYAEYICLHQDSAIAIKPNNMSYIEAAPVPNGGLTALLICRKANMQQGQKMLIYGASGSVGTYAVQLAKYFGAEVTAVCSTSNLDLVASLGADKTVDYTREDFSQTEVRYDVVFDAVGKASPAQCKTILNKDGMYLNVLTSLSSLRLKSEDLVYMRKLIEAGHLQSAIDRCYPLEDIVEAHRYVEKGHKKGNVVITVAPNNISE